MMKEELSHFAADTMAAYAHWYGVPVYDDLAMLDILADTIGCRCRDNNDPHAILVAYLAEPACMANTVDRLRELYRDAANEGDEMLDRMLWLGMDVNQRLDNPEYSRLLSCLMSIIHALQNPLARGL